MNFVSVTGHIFIEGEIGTEVTPKTVRDDIAAYPQAQNYIVHINSGGGDVYDGYQIGSILKNLGKPTAAHIGAVCASIATYISGSCDSVVMSPHGDFMIHLPTGQINGNAEDLRRGAAQLDRIKSELIDRYMPRVAKKGVTREQLSAMIDKETSMSPSEALSLGFVDAVQEKMKVAARMDVNKFNMEAALTKEEAKGMFDGLLAKMSKMATSLIKFKNAVTLTLEDGTIVSVMAENPEGIAGAQITLEDGTPVPAGTYQTQDGLQITVDAESKITEAEPMANTKENDEVAKLKEENAALKQQIEASTKTAEENVKKEVAKVTASMTSQFANLKKEVEAMKAKTFGDESAVVTEEDNGKDFKNQGRPEDPMVQLWDVFKSRYNYNA